MEDVGDVGTAITKRISDLIRAEYPDAEFVFYVGLPESRGGRRFRRGFCTTSLAWETLPDFLRAMAEVHEQELYTFRPWKADGELS